MNPAHDSVGLSAVGSHYRTEGETGVAAPAVQGRDDFSFGFNLHKVPGGQFQRSARRFLMYPGDLSELAAISQSLSLVVNADCQSADKLADANRSEEHTSELQSR